MAPRIKRPQWDARSSGRIEGDACRAGPKSIERASRLPVSRGLESCDPENMAPLDDKTGEGPNGDNSDLMATTQVAPSLRALVCFGADTRTREFAMGHKRTFCNVDAMSALLD